MDPTTLPVDLPVNLTGIPVQYQLYFMFGLQLLKWAAEGYSTIRAGGGLRRIVMAFWFGEQLPKVVAEDYKKELSSDQPKSNP